MSETPQKNEINGVVADAKVTLNNATLTADGYGMYLAGNADTTITGVNAPF